MSRRYDSACCFAAARSARRRHTRLALLSWVVTVVAWTMVGCQTGPYRAADLPAELRAAPGDPSKEINLANLVTSGSNSSQIGVGDLVEITIASGSGLEEGEPLQARVSQDGTVFVPPIGEVPVAGAEPFDAGQRIAAAAVQRGIYKQPSVVLKVTEQAVNRVSVLGAVNEPGVHKLPRGSSDLVTALASAGGLSEEADLQVEILQHHQPSFLADSMDETEHVVAASYEGSTAELPSTDSTTVARIPLPAPPVPRTCRLNLAQAEPGRRKDYMLSDGDVVMVLPKKPRVLQVTGLVNKPNQFEIEHNEDVRVLDAIAMAGGVESPVADKVYVIRQLEGMPEPVLIQVSISKAKRDGEENLLLKTGDLVSVESTLATQTFDTLSTFFRVGVSMGGSVFAF